MYRGFTDSCWMVGSGQAQSVFSFFKQSIAPDGPEVQFVVLAVELDSPLPAPLDALASLRVVT